MRIKVLNSEILVNLNVKAKKAQIMIIIILQEDLSTNSNPIVNLFKNRRKRGTEPFLFFFYCFNEIKSS